MHVADGEKDATLEAFEGAVKATAAELAAG
jgi:hypothetical protein